MQRPGGEGSRQQDDWVKPCGGKKCGTLEDRKKASKAGTSQGRKERQGPDLRRQYVRSLDFMLTSMESTNGSLTRERYFFICLNFIHLGGEAVACFMYQKEHSGCPE